MIHENDEIAWLTEHYPETAPPSGEVTDHARQALMREIASETRRPRLRRSPRLSGAAAAGVFAALAAVVITAGHGGHAVVTKTAPGAPSHHRTASTDPRAKSQDTEVHATSGTANLVSLARTVAQAPAMPGNATLVIHQNTVAGNPTPFTGEDLYEDNGDYYYGANNAELQQALEDPSGADPTEGKVINAAGQSAGLTPTQAAENIYNASPAPTRRSNRRPLPSPP